MVWSKVRQLVKYGDTEIKYDSYGKRIKKGDTTFTYDGNGNLIKQSDGFEFYYDHTGVTSFTYAEETYYYRKDVQGNIIAILDSNGEIVVEYVYDAWGNHRVVDKFGVEIKAGSHVGNLNPFRYRGYYYDKEFDLYYLKTRYYSPALCRFINADSIDYADPQTINGLNLYAYCNNNPVMNIDPDGHLALSFILVSMLLGAIIGGTMSAVKASQDGLGLKDAFLATLGGAIMGAFVSLSFALGGAAVTGLTVLGHAVSGVTLFAIASLGTALAGIADYQLTSMAYHKETSIDGYIMSGIEGFLEGTISFVLGGLAGLHGYFKFAEKSLFKPSKIIETVFRLALFGIPSALIRTGIKETIKFNWGLDW